MKHCFQSKQRTLLLAFVLTAVCSLSSFRASGQATVDCSVNANCANAYCNFAANIEKGCRCFDGIDNDGDGKIDKADSNCATYYGLTFVGEGSNCSIVPPGNNDPFDLINTPITSAQNTADTQSKVSVGDIDGDGVPDAVITSKWNSEIRVIATRDPQADGTQAGKVKSDFNLSGNVANQMFSDAPNNGPCKPNRLLFEHENLIADIDKDGKAELYGVVSNRGGNPQTPPTCFYLVGFKYAPDDLVPLFKAVSLGTDRPGTFGIADMDGDGKAEIYLRDRIYAAETGALLASAGGDWDLDVTSAPVAVNISGSTVMELVCGTKIYSIPSLANRNPATPGTLTLLHDMNTIGTNDAYVKLMNDPVEYGVDTHSSCSVADIDRDGNIDVVISGALNSVSGPTTVFYWNVIKNTVSIFSPPDPGYANGWIWGTGRVNLGDANGDGKTDFSFIAGSKLWCLTTDASGNLVPLWANPRTINDTRSGVLTVTIYDFNNDGQPEMVYRDSQILAVIDGATGTQLKWSSVCQSHTYTEGPIIADVNGDGGTDICVTCNTSNSFDINDGLQQQALGQFRLYYSAANDWLPTRKVWNQPGYFVVNIKDNLQLPFPQLDQNLIYSNAPCPNGLPGPQMPMNVFLNQVPYLSADGCPVFPAPDLSFTGDDPANLPFPPGDPRNQPAVEVIPPICGNLGIQVRFRIINDGDLPLTLNVPVSFWKANPTLATTTQADKLFTTTINISNLAVDGTLLTGFSSFNGTGGTFRLYIVLNNSGATLPINLNAASTTECRLQNNMYSVDIVPDPFTTTLEKIADNFKCVNSGPNTGELRVRIFKGGIEETDYSQYGFQWYTGPAAGPQTIIPGATNYNITGLGEGTYSALVRNVVKNCTGQFVEGTIIRTGVDPDVIITATNQTLCNPANGSLTAVVQGVGGNTGYTFEWTDVSGSSLSITTSTVNNLSAGNYKLIVGKAGCFKGFDAPPILPPNKPDAQASVLAHVIDCLNPNSGSVTADAVFNAVIQNPANYTFTWYFYNSGTGVRGSVLPAANGTGQTRTGLAAGSYQVTIRDNTTQCDANQSPIVTVLSQTVPPTALITRTSDQTSCDNNLPNGVLTASATGGSFVSPNDFTFEWFRGDNTLAVNKIPIAGGPESVSGTKGEILNGVKGGGIEYTVKVTTPNNCSATFKNTVVDVLKHPTVVLTPINNSICDPALATSAYNGGMNAVVTFDGVTVTDFTNYSFKWKDGPLVTSPALPQTGSSLTQLDGGFYTVIVEKTDVHCPSLPDTEEVLNATVNPVLTTQNIASTNCIAGKENGEARILTVDAQNVPVAGFRYQWYMGSDTTAVGAKMIGKKSSTLTNVQGGPGALANAISALLVNGEYTVVALNTATGCKTDETIQVPDAHVLPTFALVATPNSICDPAVAGVSKNGQVNSTTATPGYTGGYTGTKTYSYNWYDGEFLGSPLPTHDPSTTVASGITGLQAGFYSGTVTITEIGCTSAFSSAEVEDLVDIPDLVIIATPSTNCEPGKENGKAIINTIDLAPVPPTGFSYKWYRGNNILAPGAEIVGQGGSSLLNVQGGPGLLASGLIVNGQYSVVTVNLSNGCKSTTGVQIGDAQVKPTLLLAQDPNGICDPAIAGTPFDGRVYQSSYSYVNPNYTGAQTLIYKWYNGEYIGGLLPGALPNHSPNQTSVSEITGLQPGFYTGTVTIDQLGCTSSPVSIEVEDEPNIPDLTFETDPSTNCIATKENGNARLLTIDAAPIPATGFTYKWYRGNNIAAPGAEIIGESDHLLEKYQGGPGLLATGLIVNGQYTVRVVNSSNGCATNETLQIADAQVKPTLTLDADPNSICDETIAGVSVNGKVKQLAYSYVNLNYTGPQTLVYNWYDGEYTGGAFPGPLTNHSPSSTSIGEITELPAAFYTATVTIDELGCTSVPQSIEVEDELDLPDLTFDIDPSTNCEVGKENGNFEILTIDGPTLPTTGYGYTWYKGNDITAPGALIAGETDEELENVQGGPGLLATGLIANGQYTVTVTNQSNGCKTNLTAQINDKQVKPVFDLAPKPNTICDPVVAGIAKDGDVHQISFSFVNPDYTGTQTLRYDWYAGEYAGTPLPSHTTATTGTVSQITGLPAAFYTGTVTIVELGCTSDFVSREVIDDVDIPALTPDFVESTNCTIANKNGEARVDEIDALPVPATGYRYRWFMGNDVAAPGALMAGETSEILSNVQGGPGALSPFVNPLIADGEYTVEVTRESNGCKATMTIQVPDGQVKPTLTLNASPNTVCVPTVAVPYDGSVSVNGTFAYTGSYTGTKTASYEWFNGDVLTPPSPNGTATANTSLDNLPEGFYSAKVTIIELGCTSDFATEEVTDGRWTPVIDIAVIPQTACLPANPNGLLAATIDETTNGGGAGETSGYTFVWTGPAAYGVNDPALPGGPTPPAPATTTLTPGELENVDGNENYLVTVTSDKGCESSEGIFLPDQIITPTVVLTPTAQTECVPPDGSILAAVTPAPGATHTYTYYWMKEQPLTTTTVPATVIANVNGAPAIPNRKFTGAANGVNDTHAGLIYGDYTLVVVNDFTSCVSQTYTANVGDDTQSDIDFNIIGLPSQCAVADGTLAIDAARLDATPTTFTFEMFIGGPTNAVTPINFYTNAPTFDLTVNDGVTLHPTIAFPQALGPVASNVAANRPNLASNLYSIVATDATGCKTLETFFLPFLDAHGINKIVTNSEICPYTIGDGAIEIRTVPPTTNAGLNQTRFTYSFYEGGTANPANLIAMPSGGGTNPFITSAEICDGLDNDGDGAVDESCVYTNPQTWPVSAEVCNNAADDDGDGLADALDPDCTQRIAARNLAPGFYTVEIQENVSGNSCKVYEVIEIKSDALAPVISLVGDMTPNSACDMAAADGAIQINVDQDPDDLTTPTYNIDLDVDPDNQFPQNAVVAGNYTATGLSAGTHTFTVLASNGCSATKPFVLVDQPAVAQIIDGNIAVIDAEFCDASLETSARIEITKLEVTGREICGNGIDDDGDTLIDGADPDCNDSFGDYVFEWFTDAALTTSILGPTAGVNGAVAGGEVLSNVASPAPSVDITIGTYYVVATKALPGLTGGVGCFSAALKVDLGDKTVDPVPVLTPSGDMACDGNFEGQIALTVTTPSLGLGAGYTNPGATSEYTYVWATAPPNPVALGTTASNDGDGIDDNGDDDLVTNLGPGTYALTVRNENTGCEFNTSTTIIKISPPVFTLSATPTNQNLCFPSGAIAVTDVQVDGTPDGTGNFDFEWYRASPGSAQLQNSVPANIVAPVLNTAAYATMGADDYYVVAVRKPNTDPGSGCKSAPLRVTVQDVSVDPIVAMTPFFDTSCDNGFEGRLELNVSEDPASAGIGAQYVYNWTSTSSPSTTPANNGTLASLTGAGPGNGTGAGNEPFPNLNDGAYTLIAGNNVTGCTATATVTILPSQTPIVIVDADPTDQDVCRPDGQIEIVDVSVGGSSVPGGALNTEFTYTWYRNDPSTPQLRDGQGVPAPITVSNLLFGIGAQQYPTMGAGTYFVKAKRNNGVSPGSGCESAVIMRVINDVSEDPIATLTPFSDTSCDAGFEGRIEVNITEVAGTPGVGSPYTYDWSATAGGNAPADNGTIALLNGTGTGTESITGRNDGNYTLVVANNATNCSTTANTTILPSQTPIVIVSALATDQRLCTFDGEIEIQNVSVGGVDDPDINTEFTYTWYRTDPNGPALVDGQGVPAQITVSQLVLGAGAQQYPTIGAGTYFVKARRNNGAIPGSGCESAVISKIIDDESKDPIISLIPSSDTSCDTGFEGAIDMTVTEVPGTPGVGQTYSYDWSSNTASTPPDEGVIASFNGAGDGNENYTQRDDGDYIVTVANNFTRCTSIASTTILPTLTPIVIPSANVTHQDICDFDGEIEVTSVLVGSTPETDPLDLDGDFTYTWYKDDPASSPLLDDASNPIQVRSLVLGTGASQYSAVEAGIYYVKAKRNLGVFPGSGCESAPILKEILDISVNPTVSFASIANTSCDNNFDAQITVNASDASGPGAGANYALTWTSIPAASTLAAPPLTPTPYTTLASDNVGPGNYVIHVVNQTTLCESNGGTMIVNNPRPLEILTVQVQDQDICYADGRIEVSSLNTGTPVNYSFKWFKDDPSSTPLTNTVPATITGPILEAPNYATMSAGTYYVVGQKTASSDPGSGCITPPFKVIVNDLHVDPVVSFTYTPNSSCDEFNPNGVVITTAQEKSGVVPGTVYTFNWTLNGNPVNPLTITTATPTSTVNDAADGTYVVTATNFSTTGCDVIGNIVVEKDLNISTPNVISTIEDHPTDCLPSGASRVETISVGGVTFFNSPPDDLDVRFNFEWYADDFVPTAQIAGETNHNISTLDPGKYYVLVQDLTTACKSTPKEVVINDDNIVYPVVEVVQSKLQVSCISGVGSAELMATADGFSDANANYTFTWFHNLDATPPSALTGTSTFSNLVPGDYSVEVQDLSTGCFAEQLYIVPDDKEMFRPGVSLNADPRLNCLVNDGTILARELNFDPNRYPFPAQSFSAELYSGAGANTAVPGTSMPVLSAPARTWLSTALDVGTYTIKITDNNTGCTTTDEIAVADGRVAPVVVIMQENPLINCDPARPNGQLSATADQGRVGGYGFEWFRGTAATGASIESQNILIGETIGSYTVRVTNDITGCFNDETGQITDGRLVAPTPTPEVVFHRTHCVIPDGWVKATVGGITLNYSFDWYDGETDAGSPDFNGVDYPGRAEGFYTVKVMDITTGCYSLPAKIEVLDQTETPELVFTTTASFCEDLPDNFTKGNGSVQVDMVPAYLFTDSIAWVKIEEPTRQRPELQESELVEIEFAGTGAYVTELFPGFYKSEVTTVKGCRNWGVTEVKTEIRAYNLVTRNTDGKNDAFVVDCISRFPNNNVKIFNRSGVKVYEADGYDNNEKVFRGFGENGVYTTGNDLPVGTYFYIIDKRDGSKPRTGYLELVK